MVHLAQWNRLRPTQGAIGYVQVLAKRASFLALPPESRRSFAQDQAIKVVRGPTGRLHVIDHHHWARAWFDMGLPEAPVNIAEDFSGLAGDPFLQSMSEHGWLHPFDALVDWQNSKIGAPRIRWASGRRLPEPCSFYTNGRRLRESRRIQSEVRLGGLLPTAHFLASVYRRRLSADAGRSFYLLAAGRSEGPARFHAREGMTMTRRYTIEVLSADAALIDRAAEVSFTLTSGVAGAGIHIDVLETLEENLASRWIAILDSHDKPYAARVLDGTAVVTERWVREPGWKRE